MPGGRTGGNCRVSADRRGVVGVGDVDSDFGLVAEAGSIGDSYLEGEDRVAFVIEEQRVGDADFPAAVDGEGVAVGARNDRVGE